MKGHAAGPNSDSRIDDTGRVSVLGETAPWHVRAFVVANDAQPDSHRSDRHAYPGLDLSLWLIRLVWSPQMSRPVRAPEPTIWPTMSEGIVHVNLTFDLHHPLIDGGNGPPDPLLYPVPQVFPLAIDLHTFSDTKFASPCHP